MFGIGGPELVILIPIFIVCYLLPSLIAKARRHKNILPIFVLNVLLGWTFLGWVVALVWSFAAQEVRNLNYKSEGDNIKYSQNIDSGKCYLCAKIFPTDRIRIDCVSAANHNLIRLLDKPGVSAYSVYKEISFFEQGAGSAFLKSALFSRRGSALTCKQAAKK